MQQCRNECVHLRFRTRTCRQVYSLVHCPKGEQMWRGGAMEVPMASSYYDSLLIFNVFVIPNWEISSSACKHKIFTWSASAAGIVYPRFTHSDGSGRGNPWNGSWCDAISCQCLLPNVINSMFRVKLCHSCSLLPLVLGKLLGEKDFAKTCFIFFLFLKALEFCIWSYRCTIIMSISAS